MPLIPRETPILMLSGACDEVIPPEHMQGLWEIVQRRPPALRRRDPDDDDDDMGKPRGPRGFSRFVQFDKGTHSECCRVRSCGDAMLSVLTPDDTCVQHGYWTTVAEFVASLGESSPADS